MGMKYRPAPDDSFDGDCFVCGYGGPCLSVTLANGTSATVCDPRHVVCGDPNCLALKEQNEKRPQLRS